MWRRKHNKFPLIFVGDAAMNQRRFPELYYWFYFIFFPFANIIFLLFRQNVRYMDWPDLTLLKRSDFWQRFWHFLSRWTPTRNWHFASNYWHVLLDKHDTWRLGTSSEHYWLIIVLESQYSPPLQGMITTENKLQVYPLWWFPGVSSCGPYIRVVYRWKTRPAAVSLMLQMKHITSSFCRWWFWVQHRVFWKVGSCWLCVDTRRCKSTGNFRCQASI